MLGNLFNALPSAQEAECFEDIFKQAGCRVERIVSFGQSSPKDFWYEQNWDEWVLLLSGEAQLTLANQAESVRLLTGDHLFIPAGIRHRIDFTAPNTPTIWLAIHLNEPSNTAAETQA